MEYISVLVDLSPIIICGIMIAVLNKPMWISGIAGVILSIIVANYKCNFGFNYHNINEILKTSWILSFSAILVIIPGLYFNNILRTIKSTDKIVEWIDNINIKKELKVLALILGILPALESLTGFGVSLFLAIPLFFKMYESDKAHKLSILSMNAMPWGTLGLAFVIGSSLSGYSLTNLAENTAIFSAAIFPIIACIVLYVIGGFNKLKQSFYLAIIFGLLFGFMLYLFAKINIVEISGVFAGLSIAIIIFALFSYSTNSINKPKKNILSFIYPYLLVLALVCLFKFITPIKNTLTTIYILSSEHVHFAPLSSPGIVLILVSILLLLMNINIKLEHKIILKRSWFSSLGLFLFILMSQVMSQTGIISDIVKFISNINNEYIIMAIMPILGIIGGFITGSAVASNVLLIQIQQEVGNHMGLGLIFSAMQNSAGGHSAMFSLSIIILATTIAKDYIKPQNYNANTESFLLKFNIKCLILLYIALVANLFIHYIIK